VEEESFGSNDERGEILTGRESEDRYLN